MFCKLRIQNLFLASLFIVVLATFFANLLPLRAAETGNCDDIGQKGLDLGDCFALNSTTKVRDVFTTPSDLINLLVPVIFIGAGIVLFFLLIYGGFLFITGDVKGKDKAMEMFGSAGIGFIVMFSAYWILQLIKVITGANVGF